VVVWLAERLSTLFGFRRLAPLPPEEGDEVGKDGKSGYLLPMSRR